MKCILIILSMMMSLNLFASETINCVVSSEVPLDTYLVIDKVAQTATLTFSDPEGEKSDFGYKYKILEMDETYTKTGKLTYLSTHPLSTASNHRLTMFLTFPNGRISYQNKDFSVASEAIYCN